MPRRAVGPELPSDTQARIKTAVIAVIAQGGFAAMSVESICTLAGVPVAAFHQRWAAPEDALADALDERARLSRLPDTGNVISDLVAYMQGYLDACSDPEFTGFMFYIGAQVRVDLRLAQKLAPGFEDRRRDNRLLIERAIARGELLQDTDPDVVLDRVLETVLAWMGSGVRPPQVELELVAQRLVANRRLH
jgi:AcrR family transcriptional regulator